MVGLSTQMQFVELAATVSFFGIDVGMKFLLARAANKWAVVFMIQISEEHAMNCGIPGVDKVFNDMRGAISSVSFLVSTSDVRSGPILSAFATGSPSLKTQTIPLGVTIAIALAGSGGGQFSALMDQAQSGALASNVPATLPLVMMTFNPLKPFKLRFEINLPATSIVQLSDAVKLTGFGFVFGIEFKGPYPSGLEVGISLNQLIFFPGTNDEMVVIADFLLVLSEGQAELDLDITFYRQPWYNPFGASDQLTVLFPIQLGFGVFSPACLTLYFF
jgi:hypothetical protein